MTPKEFQEVYNARVYGDRLFLFSLNDGTAWFEIELRMILEVLGCSDIKVTARRVNNDKGRKPWCNILLTASGKLPKEALERD